MAGFLSVLSLSPCLHHLSPHIHPNTVQATYMSTSTVCVSAAIHPYVFSLSLSHCLTFPRSISSSSLPISISSPTPSPPLHANAKQSIQLTGSKNPPHAALLIVASSSPAGYNLSSSSRARPRPSSPSITTLQGGGGGLFVTAAGQLHSQFKYFYLLPRIQLPAHDLKLCLSALRLLLLFPWTKTPQVSKKTKKKKIPHVLLGLWVPQGMLMCSAFV